MPVLALLLDILLFLALGLVYWLGRAVGIIERELNSGW